MSRRKAIDWLLRKADRLIVECDGEIAAWRALLIDIVGRVDERPLHEGLIDLREEAEGAIEELEDVRGKLQVLE